MKKHLKKIILIGAILILLPIAILYILFFMNPFYNEHTFLHYIESIIYLNFMDPTGEAAAMNGMMYHEDGRHGDPVREEYAEYWTLRAANKGHVRSMVNMGRICWLKEQDAEGLKWFIKAAQNGYECEEYKEFIKPFTNTEMEEINKKLDDDLRNAREMRKRFEAMKTNK